MKIKASKLLFLSTLILSFNACKDDCSEDTIINYPLYTEHRIFTNYKVGDSISFVSENLDTAKLFLVKVDTFTDQSISNTDIDCDTDNIYNTTQLRCFWKGSSTLLREIKLVFYTRGSIPDIELEFFGKNFDRDKINFYSPPPFFHLSNYDSILMKDKYITGFKFSRDAVVILFNSNEGLLIINYANLIWKRIY
jgi:hypothetical protein